MELKQKRGLNSRNFILTEDKLIVETKSLVLNNRFEIYLDKIGLDIQYKSSAKLGRKIVYGIFVSMYLLVLISFFVNVAGSSNKEDIIFFSISTIIWTGMFLIVHFSNPKDDIILVGAFNKSIEFYRNIPDEITVLNFIERIKENSNKYVVKKYTPLNSNTLSKEEFNQQIEWLFKNYMIKYEHYNLIKSNFESLNEKR